MLEKIVRVFADQNVHIAPALQVDLPKTPSKEDAVKAGQFPFEALRKELVSRKYSYTINRSSRYSRNGKGPDNLNLKQGGDV